MIKYWKTIGLVVCIALIFSFFYMQKTREIETYPSFTLQTQEGDWEEIQPITLYGDFHTGEHTHGFSLHLHETIYAQQMPYLERLSGFYKQEEIKRLEQSHPSYMRGKPDDLSMYTESDAYIVQADMDWGSYTNGKRQNMAFQLSVLHKELNKEARMKIEIPEKDQSSFVSLEKMYAVGEKLHMLTSHERDGDDGMNVFEMRLYTIQLDRGKIGSTDVLYTWNQEDVTENITITPIENPQSILADQRMLVLKTVAHADMDIDNELQVHHGHPDQVSYELMAYDFRTKNFEIFSLPSQIKNKAEFISYQDNSDVLLMQENQGNLEVIKWQLGSDEQPGPSLVPTSTPMESYTTYSQGEYLYVYVGHKARNKNIGEVHVQYVPTGEWVYAGDVQPDRPLNKEEEVMIHSIE